VIRAISFDIRARPSPPAEDGRWSKSLLALARVSACGVGAPGVAHAQEMARALSMLLELVASTQSFLKFIDKVNAAGQGVVRIEFVGGPEADPHP
jgi:hypothetical protein